MRQGVGASDLHSFGSLTSEDVKWIVLLKNAGSSVSELAELMRKTYALWFGKIQGDEASAVSELKSLWEKCVGQKEANPPPTKKPFSGFSRSQGHPKS